jgi:rhamnogalacturonan endolyase
MRRSVSLSFFAMALGLTMTQAIGAQVRSGGPGSRLNNLKVLSDKIDDTTTPENILKSFVKPGMTDAQRSKALWTAAVKYRHQTAPPNEFLSGEWEAHDPVKIFDVYGYCMCCCCSSLIEALNRLDGREAQGRILNGHSVAEVKYGDTWHMYDCSLITLFPKPEDGALAGVDEISRAVKEWYRQNPGMEGDSGKLFGLMKSDGWTGWKTHGPALLANTPYNRMGYYPARTHGWDATMTEYNRNSEVYEYGYQLGHRALFSLRPGESLVREAGNHGLHVNRESDPNFGMLKEIAPQGDLAYLPEFLPGYRGGVVGNGYHRYAPDLAGGGLAQGALVYTNLTANRPSESVPALSAATISRPGVAVIEMSSPYVYLGGRIQLSAVARTVQDHVTLSLSTNNGRTFTPLWSTDKLGITRATIDLGDRITRRYAYQLRIEIVGSAAHTAGLNAFAIENDIQHAPRTLPWLGKGSNTITVAADTDPGIATRTVNCRITPDATFTKNETSSSMGVVFDNLKVTEGGGCWWQYGVGTMTVPIETPGDMVALRFGGHVRARGAKDLVRLKLSFDGGKTWVEAGQIAGPTPATTRYFRFTGVPPHTRKALLRYEMTGNNTVGLFSFRADADYRDPLAQPSPGTLHPFVVVHRWRENGREKSARTVISKLPFTYKIDTAADPEMVSVAYEMPSGTSGTGQQRPSGNGRVMLTRTDTTFTLANAFVTAKVDRRSGDLVSLQYQNEELLGAGSGHPYGYWSHTPTRGTRTVSATTIDPSSNAGARAEVSVKGFYSGAALGQGPGGSVAADIETRYTLGSDDHGLYTYSILEHKPDYPATSVGEARFGVKLNDRIFDYMTIDARRSKLMITAEDWNRGTQLNMKEARRMTTGRYAGRVEHKYDYSAVQFDTPAFGWYGTHQKIGLWFINPSNEYLSGGATKVELTGHRDVSDGAAPTLLNYWRGSHYGGSECSLAAGEAWTKVVGPFLIYCNASPTSDASWKDALLQATRETEKWPLGWVEGVAYPHKEQRAAVTGRVVLRDPQLPEARLSHLLVGLTAPNYLLPDGSRGLNGPTVDWQRDAKYYQFWARGDAQGRFTIPNVRAGKYTLHAISDGVLGEYAQLDVVVEAGKPLDLGVLEWKPTRYGKQIWEIGVANRSAEEFRHGDHYWEWGLYLKYPQEFPNDVRFVIGKSDVHADWNYCQPPRDDGKPTTSSVVFRMPMASAGKATLRLAFASTSARRVSVTVNDLPAGDTGPLPDTATIRRDGIRGYWFERDVIFDAKLLHAGENVLQLTVPVGGVMSGVEYDYLRLELAPAP